MIDVSDGPIVFKKLGVSVPWSWSASAQRRGQCSTARSEPRGANCGDDHEHVHDHEEQQLAAILETIHLDWDALDVSMRDKIHDWLRSNKGRFKTRYNKLSTTTKLEHEIQHSPDAKPVSCPPRRLHPALDSHMRDTVAKLLEDG